MPAQVVDRSRLVNPPHGYVRRLLRLSRFAQVAVALAACLLIVVAGGAAAYYGNRFLAAEQALKATYLNQPVEWDAGEGKPIFTVGSTVVVKGRARSGVVDKLRVYVSPGLEGPKEWSREISIPAGEFGEAEPFEIAFKVPKDSQVRVATVELMLTEGAHRLEEYIDLKGFRYVVRIACRPTGAIAYYPKAQGPVIAEHPKREDDYWYIKIRTQTTTGFATIAVRDRGTGRYAVEEPQPVNYDGQLLTFRIGTYAYSGWFEVTAFAAESGSDGDLINTIERGRFAENQIGDVVKVIPAPPPVRGELVVPRNVPFERGKLETLVIEPAPGPPRWGKHHPGASGELQYQARMKGEFVARLKLTGLEKGKSYDLRFNGKAGADGNDVLKQIEVHGDEGVYNFQKVKADDSGSVTVRVQAPRLKPGKYDVKFFVGESNEAEKYPIVLYNNDFVFELMKE